jgi:hypothetical protein
MMIAYDGAAAEPAHNMSSSAENLEVDPGQPGEPELLCSSRGEVYDPAAGEWAAIIDPHHHGPAIARIDDANHRAERQRAMRRG